MNIYFKIYPGTISVFLSIANFYEPAVGAAVVAVIRKHCYIIIKPIENMDIYINSSVKSLCIIAQTESTNPMILIPQILILILVIIIIMPSKFPLLLLRITTFILVFCVYCL